MSENIVYKCPGCGATEELYVTQCRVTGRMPLSWDGFGIEGESWDERVECGICGHEDVIEQFMVD